MGMFKSHGEVWKCYNAIALEFPSKEDLSTAKVIIIGGSKNSAYDINPHTLKLKQFILNTHKTHPNIKWVGLCYGHQIINLALGGSVEKMKNNFLCRREVITINDNFCKLPYVVQSGVFEDYDLKENKN